MQVNCKIPGNVWLNETVMGPDIGTGFAKIATPIRKIKSETMMSEWRSIGAGESKPVRYIGDDAKRYGSVKSMVIRSPASRVPYAGSGFRTPALRRVCTMRLYDASGHGAVSGCGPAWPRQSSMASRTRWRHAGTTMMAAMTASDVPTRSGSP